MMAKEYPERALDDPRIPMNGHRTVRVEIPIDMAGPGCAQDCTKKVNYMGQNKPE